MPGPGHTEMKESQSYLRGALSFLFGLGQFDFILSNVHLPSLGHDCDFQDVSICQFENNGIFSQNCVWELVSPVFKRLHFLLIHDWVKLPVVYFSPITWHMLSVCL